MGTNPAILSVKSRLRKQKGIFNKKLETNSGKKKRPLERFYG